MRRSRTAAVILIVFALSALVYVSQEVEAEVGTEGGYTPAWKVGDWWKLRTSYRNLSAKHAETRWSAPVTWKYTVEGEAVVGGIPCYVVSVRSDEVDAWNELYFEKKTLTLIQADIYYTLRGVSKTHTVRYNQEVRTPVITEYSVAPYDTPNFPLRRLEERTPERRVFYRSLGRNLDMEFKKEIKQEVSLMTAREASRAFPIPTREVSDFQGNYYKVEITTRDYSISQLWNEKKPWYSYSQSKTVRSWLIDSSR